MLEVRLQVLIIYAEMRTPLKAHLWAAEKQVEYVPLECTVTH